MQGINWRNNLPHRLNLSLFILALFLMLMIRSDPPVWLGYGDPYDYLHQSTLSLQSQNFYMPEKAPQFYPRPFTVPLFYKLAGSNPNTIILLQKLLYALSIYLLCSVFLNYLKRLPVKVFFLVSFYLFTFWWNMLGWTNTLLSESLSISFLFLWMATFLLFLQKRTILRFVLHGIITVLFSFTRDTWPYFLLIFYFSYGLLSLRGNKQLRAAVAGFFLISVALLFTQQHTAQVGQRYRLPILNNIVFRILPNPVYLHWFEANGMPCANLLKEKYSSLHVPTDIYPLYNDTAFAPLFSWVSGAGRGTYQKFLLTHPFHTLLLEEKLVEVSKLFAHDFGYTGDAPDISWLSNNIFPFFNLASIILLLWIFITINRRESIVLWKFPLTLLITGILHAILVYHADALEIERHLFMTNILIQFLGLYLVCFLLDSETARFLLKQWKIKFKQG